MKIGILTQPLHLNYGGIIQNWALQQVLKSMGHEPVMINRCGDIPSRTPRLMVDRCLSYGKHMFLKMLGRDSWARFCNPFSREYFLYRPQFADKAFCTKRIIKTPALYSDDELRQYISRSDIDAFIVGSDQVWRQKYSPRLETYFLDFLSATDKRKRIAYAASFGTAAGFISADKLPVCQELLAHFDAVSVREDSGQTILHDVFGRRDAVKVLDPTLLLRTNDYRSLIKDKLDDSVPYIAAYILDDNDDKDAILNDVATHLNTSVKRMSVNYCGTRMPTVPQWLSTFADAEFVVTDSFHGCVFSIIFRKPFIAIGNVDRGLDRFTSLLGSLELNNRLVNSFNEFKLNRDMLLSGIDYNRVTMLLDEQRHCSLNFLTDALA